MASPRIPRPALLLFVASLVVLQGCRKLQPPPEVSQPDQINPIHPASPSPQPPPAAPLGPRHIYSETADPRADIAAALKQAQREHKHVLIDFGGDWCSDCQVLDIYFRQSPNAQLLARNYVLAHVFVDSQIDNNLDLGEKYHIPLKKGVPALAVLDASGKLLYSQNSGEFESMSRVTPQAVTDFLERWKP